MAGRATTGALRHRASGVAHLREAVAAIDRSVAARAERNGGIGAAVAADDGERFPLTAVSAAASTATTEVVPGLPAPGVAAGLASLGVVGEPTGLIKFLFAYCENELCATVTAFQSHV